LRRVRIPAEQSSREDRDERERYQERYGQGRKHVNVAAIREMAGTEHAGLRKTFDNGVGHRRRRDGNGYPE
jgi:hypothetical protein